MTKATTRARYTLEFKQETGRLVEGGQSIAAAARTLGVVDQTLFNPKSGSYRVASSAGGGLCGPMTGAIRSLM